MLAANTELTGNRQRGLHVMSAAMKRNQGKTGRDTDKKSTAPQRIHIHYQSIELEVIIATVFANSSAFFVQ